MRCESGGRWPAPCKLTTPPVRPWCLDRFSGRFSADVFIEGGVPREKVVIIPEAVNTDVGDQPRWGSDVCVCLCVWGGGGGEGPRPGSGSPLGRPHVTAHLTQIRQAHVP
jgi:hypothetical protein